jgi:crotonobetaine/carnitine-CoA ligase
MPHPRWFPDPGLPAAEACALPAILRRRAAQAPDGPCAVFEGSGWSNRAALEVAERTAAALAGLGVRPGDRVLNALPNSAAHLRVLFGAALLGATPVPVHTSLRGAFLENALQLAGAQVIVTHVSLLDAFAEAPSSRRSVLVARGDADAPRPAGVLGAEALQAEPPYAIPEHAPGQPWDLAALMLTSGTTGRTKAVRVPNAQLWTIGKAHFGYLQPDDRLLITTPLCHIAPLSALMGALMQDACVIVLESFRTQSFWDDVRRLGATAVPGMGATLLHFLNSAPPQADDADNGLRMVNVTAVNPEIRAFAQRFGVDFFSSFGMTEISVALASEVNSTVEGSCGRPRDGIEVRIVDAHDVEVAVGEVGEMIVRADQPWVLNDGYEGAPEATAAAWRNGWFHTGDTARRDAGGNVFFVDRVKDVIRRRGENISSLEVEQEVRAFPGVREAAAVAVASEVGDQEVLVAVSPSPGAQIDPKALIDFLVARMPHFMVPRFVRILPDLPKTPSLKVQKAVLREAGLAGDVWDRAAAGVRVGASRIGRLD